MQVILFCNDDKLPELHGSGPKTACTGTRISTDYVLPHEQYDYTCT